MAALPLNPGLEIITTEDTDYRNLTSVPKEEITQIIDAPTIYHLTPLDVLTDRGNLEVWLADAERILRQKGLEKFIDIEIPGPQISSPEAVKWLRTSRDIQGWLVQGLSEAIHGMVVSVMYHIDFADELVYNLKEKFKIMNINDAFYERGTFLDLQLSHYSSVAHYVMDLRDAWGTGAHRTTVPPIMIIVKLLKDLGTDHPGLVSYCCTMLQNAFKDAEKITSDDKNKIFRDILAQLR